MHRKDCDSLTSPRSGIRRRVALGAIAALVLLDVVQPAAAAAVRLWPKTVVDQDVVRVEDVAQVLSVVPDQAARFGEVVIKSAPKPGQDTEVTLEELRDALIRSGANPIEFTVRGSVRCQVVRALTLNEESASTEAPAESKYWWPGEQPVDQGQPTSQPAEYYADEITVAVPAAEEIRTLEQVLREYVISKTAHFGGEVHLRFSSNARQALSLTKPEYDFRIHAGAEPRLGTYGMKLEVDVLKDGKIQQTIPMVIGVSVTLPVVVAAKPINRDQVIREQDVAIENRDFFHADRIGMIELPAAIGQVSRTFVRKGEMIQRRELKPRPLINRGDLVTVWSEVGGLRVKTVAKALEAGTFGENIEVRNEASGSKYVVTITGPQSARVLDSQRSGGQGDQVSMMSLSGREGR
ncbi:MAG: flagellar basal body P-ring formation protein FlgA [Phycisphaerae bacterium]|nr:flagellar basal body P-ring formation protein FlgA [Phycisphaerae bacterium]